MFFLLLLGLLLLLLTLIARGLAWADPAFMGQVENMAAQLGPLSAVRAGLWAGVALLVLITGQLISWAGFRRKHAALPEIAESRDSKNGAPEIVKIKRARRRPEESPASPEEKLAYAQLQYLKGKMDLRGDDVRLHIAPEQGLNAYTFGGSLLLGMGAKHLVCLHEGLLRKLSSMKVAAVIAHELGHVQNRDSGTQLFMSSLQSVLSVLFFLPLYLCYLVFHMLCSVLRYVPIIGILASVFQILAIAALYVVLWLERLFLLPASLFRLWVSRRAEDAADAIAEERVGPDAIRRALWRLHLDADGASPKLRPFPHFSTLQIMTSTHPPIKSRMKAIGKRATGRNRTPRA